MRDVTLLTSNGVNVAKSLELFGDMTTYDSTLSDFLADINEKENKINYFLFLAFFSFYMQYLYPYS